MQKQTYVTIYMGVFSMFIGVPFCNNRYEINEDLEIRRTNGEKLDLKIKEGKVLISLTGKKVWYDLEWLYMISLFKVELPPELRNRLSDIYFVPVENHTRTSFRDIRNGKTMKFRRPIHLTPELRIVPCSTKYAVSKDGLTIIRVVDRKHMPRRELRGYKKVEDRYLVHRLVANAWCNNPNPTELFVVNHIDGNTTNNRASNLEWTSFSGNSRHAVNTGLKSDNLKCKVRDFETGEVIEYASVAVMCDSLGFKNRRTTNDFKYREPSNLWFGRYEVRVSGDERPWYYEGKNEVIRNGKYTVTVTHPDGRVEIVKHINDLIKRFKLWNLGKSVPSLVEVCRERFPELKFELEGNNHIHPIQVLKVETKEVLEFPSIRECCRKLGLTFFPVQYRIKSGECSIYKGYVFRIKSKDAWTIVEKRDVNYQLEATNRFNGKKMMFKSLREAARHFDCCRTRINRAIRKNGTVKSWFLKRI